MNEAEKLMMKVEDFLDILEPRVGDVWDTPGLVADDKLNPIDIISYALLRALYEDTGDAFFKCFLIQSLTMARITGVEPDFADPDSDTVH